MLKQVMIDMNVCTCDLCSWKWRSEEVPARCAKCKSTAWNNDVEKVVAESPANRLPKRKRKKKVLAPEIEELVEQGVVTRGMPPAKEGYCPHRKQKGEMCYKCDAKWGYPVLKETGS